MSIAAEENKRVVLDFYNRAVNQHDIGSAIAHLGSRTERSSNTGTFGNRSPNGRFSTTACSRETSRCHIDVMVEHLMRGAGGPSSQEALAPMSSEIERCRRGASPLPLMQISAAFDAGTRDTPPQDFQSRKLGTDHGREK
jgi:hypothetical protein